MKPASFEYHAPREIGEALTLLERYGDEAKILAGGQSLVPLLNMRLARAKAIIDINGIPELSYIREDNGSLSVGALTRHRAIEKSALIRERCPLMAEAIRWVGHVEVRNRGTIGGSLAHADPAAELPLVVTALGGEMKLVGPQGARTMKAEEFFVTFLTTGLAADEILAEVSIPAWPPHTGYSFQEISRRHGDFAVAAAAVLLLLNKSRECENTSIVLGGVGATPIRAKRSEALLKGQKISRELIEKAGLLASEDCDPSSDVHGTADYRREIVKVLTRRALDEALARAK
jgi:CO/xanthine dehydrogenase FAD-binding subunit